MGKGKGHYNKDTERARQEKQQMRGKYRNPTAVRLREKLTGENRDREIRADFAHLYKNHYNACYSGFAKRALVKNSYPKQINEENSIDNFSA